MTTTTSLAKSMFDFIAGEVGTSVTMKRRKGSGGYSPDTLGTPTYWEQPVFTAILRDANSKDVYSSGGRVKQGDINVTFLASSITVKTGTDDDGRSDSGEPEPRDQFVIGSSTYTVDLGGGALIASLDDSRSLWRVFARKVS